MQCDVALKTGGIGYQRWATVLLGQFDGCAAGAELAVAGQVTPNALTLIGSLEVYLVPESARL